MKHVLSFGGGVNSTALLLWLIDNKKPLDLVIFADTGSEMPYTYRYIEEVAKPLCSRHNIEFKTVKNFTHGKEWDSLYQYSYENKIIPIRMQRWCTKEFKIAPIRRELRKREWHKEGITLYMAISYEELTRMKDSDVKYIQLAYPLIDNKIDRDECVKIIVEHKLPVPKKSGCFFCPFQNLDAWFRLKQEYPDLFILAKKLEENNSSYPQLTLSSKPLKDLVPSSTLDDYLDDACDGGYCMT